MSQELDACHRWHEGRRRLDADRWRQQGDLRQRKRHRLRGAGSWAAFADSASGGGMSNTAVPASDRRASPTSAAISSPPGRKPFPAGRARSTPPATPPARGAQRAPPATPAEASATTPVAAPGRHWQRRQGGCTSSGSTIARPARPATRSRFTPKNGTARLRRRTARRRVRPRYQHDRRPRQSVSRSPATPPVTPSSPGAIRPRVRRRSTSAATRSSRKRLLRQRRCACGRQRHHRCRQQPQRRQEPGQAQAQHSGRARFVRTPTPATSSSSTPVPTTPPSP